MDSTLRNAGRVNSPESVRGRIAVVAGIVLSLFLAGALLLCGTVDIPFSEVWNALTGGDTSSAARMIVNEVRLPMIVTAFCAGMGLAVAGLLLQTTFNNPLAGPSILGVSTGASLGVAVVMLGLGGWLGGGVGYYAGILGGAVVGAGVVMLLLLAFSILLRGNAMLLIAGMLIGYMASSAISLLNFFSTQQGVHSYVIWGMGSFAGLTWERVAVFAPLSLVAVVLSMLFVKPLNAMLLGRRYAESMGVDIRRTRNMLLLLSGVLTAIVTAFCGPIGFLGLVMPHVARMVTGTSAHGRLLPATAIFGGGGALLCAWLSVVCGCGQLIPVNAITPLISIPVIIYIIVRRKKL